jgi:hypothetical protein
LAGLNDRERISMARPTRPVRANRRPAVALGSLLVAGSLVFAGCASNNGRALAQQACQRVDQSIALYQRSRHDPSPSQSATEAATAVDQLRTGALPPASLAAGDDPQWQALATDLEESSRVPEGDLIPSMEQQCQLADSAGPVPVGGNPGTGGGSATTMGPATTTTTTTTSGTGTGSSGT